MVRIDKVERLAHAMFYRYVGSLGRIRFDREDNYIGIVISKCGDTVTEIFYDPNKKIAKIMTFNNPAYFEERFSKLLEKIGIKSSIEICNYNEPFFCLIPHSPSQKIELEFLNR